MEFEVDVSGEDIFSKDYTIVVAERNQNKNNNPIIYGYKFSEEVLRILKSRYGQELYRYKFSKKQKSTFKVRLYSTIVFLIIKHTYAKHKLNNEIILYLCRDFEGRENDIKLILDSLLKNKLNLTTMFYFCRLPKGSNADKYAYLMRKDRKNLMKQNYVPIKLEELEEFLKK